MLWDWILIEHGRLAFLSVLEAVGVRKMRTRVL
jgi:hypothetical protein